MQLHLGIAERMYSQLQASAGIRRHRQCGGFYNCRHLQASQNHGFSERRQPHPVWGFKILKGGRGGAGVAARGRDESIVVTLAAQTGWREATDLIEA